MKVALRGSYVEYVVYMGMTERYPPWFAELLYDSTISDESNYTTYVHFDERDMSYYDKQLIEDFSVILRKPTGEVHVTDYEAFDDMFDVFRFSEFTHSGIAALREDCIEYVECHGGMLLDKYPPWFYEYFTEAFNYPVDNKTLFIYDAETHTVKASRDRIEAVAGGGVTVTEHCVFLLNKYGEIRGMTYDEFLKYYDPTPELGREEWGDDWRLWNPR